MTYEELSVESFILTFLSDLSEKGEIWADKELENRMDGGLISNRGGE